MRHVRGHHQHFTRMHKVFLAIHGEAACAFQHLHHGVAGGFVGADFGALVEREHGDADRLVLRKRTGDNLPRHNVHKRRQCLHLLMVDIADIHVFPPIMFVGS